MLFPGVVATVMLIVLMVMTLVANDFDGSPD